MVMFACVPQENKSHYRTLTKTRKYVVDGQVVTTQTTRVVVSGEENKRQEDHELWSVYYLNRPRLSSTVIASTSVLFQVDVIHYI